MTDRDRELEAQAAAARPTPTRVITLSSVEPEQVRWLWQDRLPFGKLAVLDGDPGAGKSTMAVDLAARVTTSSPMPDGDRALVEPRDVVYLSAEDGTADTLRPRFDAAGGDPGRFHVLDAVGAYDDEGLRVIWRPPRLPDDCGILEELVVSRSAGLVVVDVLSAFLAVRDGNSDGDVRRALHPLADLADRTGAVVLAIRHLRKSRGSAIYAGGGSIAVIGAARVGMIAAADPDDETGARRVLAVSKSNLAPTPAALAYHLAPAEEHGCARVQWDGPTGHRADDLLAIPTLDDEGADAADVLREILADGPRWVKDCIDAMAEAGFSKDQAKRAKGKIKARSEKFGKPGDPEAGWKWTLRRVHEEGEEGGTHTPAPFAPLALPSTNGACA